MLSISWPRGTVSRWAAHRAPQVVEPPSDVNADNIANNAADADVGAGGSGIIRPNRADCGRARRAVKVFGNGRARDKLFQFLVGISADLRCCLFRDSSRAQWPWPSQPVRGVNVACETPVPGLTAPVPHHADRPGKAVVALSGRCTAIEIDAAAVEMPKSRSLMLRRSCCCWCVRRYPSDLSIAVADKVRTGGIAEFEFRAFRLDADLGLLG